MSSDDELKFLFASAFRTAGTAEGCPPAEALLDAVDRTSDEHLRAAVIDHVAVCPVCAEAWRLLAFDRSAP